MHISINMFDKISKMKLIISIPVFIFSIIYIMLHMYECRSNYDYPFQDPTLPIDERLNNLMSLLTPEEKVFLFRHFL